MQGRMYAAAFTAQAITTALGDYDIWEIGAADDVIVILHALELVVTSETGDAAEEILSLEVIRGNTTTGNGASVTPRPLMPGFGAAQAAVEQIASTPATAGTEHLLWSSALNVRIPFEKVWTPETRPMTTQADGLIVVRWPDTVADDIVIDGTLYFEEFGS